LYWYLPNGTACNIFNPLNRDACLAALDPRTGELLKAFQMSRREFHDIEIDQNGKYFSCWEMNNVWPTPSYVQITTIDLKNGTMELVCNVTNLKRGGLETPGSFDFAGKVYQYLSWWDLSDTEKFLGMVDLATCNERKISLVSQFDSDSKKCQDWGWTGILFY